MTRGRRCLVGLGLVGVALAGLTGLALSPPGERQLARWAQQGLQSVLAPGWTADLPSFQWGLDGRVVLGGVGLRAPDGHLVVGVRRADLRLDLSEIGALRVVVEGPKIDGVVVDLTTDPAGVLDLIAAFGGPFPEEPEVEAAPYEGLPLGIELRRFGVRDVHVVYRGQPSLVWQPQPATGTALDATLDALDGVVDGVWSLPALRTVPVLVEGVDAEQPIAVPVPVVAVGGVQLASGWVEGDLSLPRGRPAAHLTGLELGAALVRPGPTAVHAAGEVHWEDDGLRLTGLNLRFGGLGLGVSGVVAELSGAVNVDVEVQAQPLDLGALDLLAGIGLAGRYEGSLRAVGPLAELGLSGRLVGVGGAAGALEVRPGSVLCVPMHEQVPAGCDYPEGEPAEPTLRWSAGIGIEGIDVNDLFPVIGAPIVLDGVLSARGHGTSWPDGLVVDRGRWDAGAMDIYGVPVRALGADLTLAGGVLSMRELDVTGVAGTVRGSGTLDLQTLALDLDAYGPLDLSMLRDLDVLGISGLGTYRARLHGDLAAEGVPIEVDGWVSGGPVAYEGLVELDRLEGPVQVRIIDGVTSVVADGARAYGVRSFGASAAELALSELRVKVDDAVRVSGRASGARLDYGELARFEEVKATYSYVQPASGDARLDVQVGVGAHALAELLGSHGTVGVTMLGEQLSLDVDLRWQDEPFVVAPAFSYHLGSGQIEVPELLFHPNARQTWRNDKPIRLRVVDGGVADAVVSLGSEQGRIELLGTLGTVGPLAGQVRLSDFDLSVLADLMPSELGDMAGTVDATLTARGQASKPELDLRLDAEQVALTPDLAELSAHGQVRVREHVATVGVGLGVAGTPLARVEGFLPLASDLSAPGLSPSGAADLHLVIEPGDLARLDGLLGGGVLPAGVGSARLDVTGDLRDPDLNARLVADLRLPGLDCCGRVELDLQRAEGQLVTHLDLLEDHVPVARVDGTASTRLGEVMAWLRGEAEAPSLSDMSLYADNLKVDGELLGLSLPSLLAVLGQDLDADGAVVGTFSVAGSPHTPKLSADLTLDGAVAGERLEASLRVEPELAGGYALDLQLGRDEQDWLTALGHVPLEVDVTAEVLDWSRGAWDLAVGGGGVPFAVVRAAVPDLEVEAGLVRLSGGVGGGLWAPRPDLEVVLMGGAARYRPLGLRLSEGEATVGVRGGGSEEEQGALRVEVKHAQVATAPLGINVANFAGERGQVEVTGVIDLHYGDIEQVSLQADLKRAWLLHLDDQQLQASGAVQVVGPWPALAVTGKVDVDQANLELDAAQLLETRDLRLDRRITLHRSELPAPEREEEAEPSLLDTLDMDVQVGLWGNVRTRVVMPVFDDLGSFGARLTRLDLQTGLAGAVDLNMVQGVISLEGDVKLQDGTARLLQAHFTLDDDSHIELTGRDYANPRLAVRGTMSVTGGDVVLKLGGSAQALELELSSDQFASDAELFTVLLTGQAPDELSSEQGKAALQAVSDLLLNSVLGGVKLGSVSVESDGTVRVGLPIGRVAFVETSLDPVPQLNENLVTVEGEFRLLPRMVLDVAYGNRLMWANLFWETRF